MAVTYIVSDIKVIYLCSMWKMSDNRFVKAMMLVCVIMQMLAFMPHHHHGTGQEACMNYAHLVSGGCLNDLCDGSHAPRQHDVLCPYSHMAVASQNEREEAVPEISDDHDHDCCGCGLCVSDMVIDDSAVRFRVDIQEYGRPGGVETYMTAYLAAALPCRAPDCMG